MSDRVTLPPSPPLLKRIRLKAYQDKMWMLLGEAEATWHREGMDDKTVILPTGFTSDGATWARDIKNSWSWLVHDYLCDGGLFSDGTECTALEASQFLSAILDEEGRNFRKFSWKWATFCFGSWKLKKKVGWV